MIIMPRNQDVDARNEILDFIRKECLKAGGVATFPLSYMKDELNKNLEKGEPPYNTNKIYRIIENLERGLSIKVYKGEGSSSNSYEYLGEKMNMVVEKNAELKLDEFNEKLDKVYFAMKELTTFCSELSQKATEQNGEIVHLRQILDDLESVGNINGSVLYKTKSANSLLPLILEENKRKNKHNEEAAATLQE
jgi:hypothetical protein